MAGQITFQISDETERELEELRREMGVETVAQVITNSLSLRKMLGKEKKKGIDIVFVDPKTQEAKELRSLD